MSTSLPLLVLVFTIASTPPIPHYRAPLDVPALSSGPVWVESSRSVSEISACVSANEHVRDRVRTATTTQECQHMTTSLLFESRVIRDERDQAREDAAFWKNTFVWGVFVVAVISIGGGIAIGKSIK